MTFANFHITRIYNQTTHKQIKGYLQNIAMTPIKFRFKPSKNNQIKPGNQVATDVMEYGILTVKKYNQHTDEAILVNKNLI